jgi:S1-C subfamily serine protease
VSRVHAEITLRSDGKAVIKDTGSRNGTIVNGRILVSEHELKKGDRVQLGDAGPELVVQEVVVRGVPVGEAVPGKIEEKEVSLVSAAEEEAVKAKGKEAPRRSFGGVGRTVFIREVVEETQRKGSKRLRWAIWSFTVLLAGVGGGLYWYFDWRTQATVEQIEARQREVFAAQQAVADSIRQAAEADFERLRLELERAQAGAAPAAVVESLRVALNEASARTASLEAALERAQTSLDRQLAMGDSLRRAAQRDLERMRSQLAQASTAGNPQALLDSLRRAVAAAEQNAAAIEDRLRAAKGVDLAAISQANQSAVGLVTAFFPDGIGDATGFVLSPSGYFVTNRHAVSEGGRMADSVKVTMADRRTQLRADVIRVAPSGGPDLALLKIRNYQGTYIQKLDWTGTHVRQGEPAALIGFPQGMALALDRTRTVRTSMSAGIFSKVVEDGIQFDGFTVGGSSGSPIFNANGEVVAVHRAGLRAGPGLSLAVPLKLLIPLMPPQLKAELGLN